MAAFEARLRVGPDGMLHLVVPPALANAEVHVTVEPACQVNGAAVRPGRPMTEREWQEFVRATAGCIPDFPDVERPGPAAFEDRGL